MTKKPAKAAEQPAEPKTLEEMILNSQSGKYSTIPLAALWAKVLRRREEHRHLTATEILDLALKDVLEGNIDWKDVKKAQAEIPVDNSAEAALTGQDKKK